MLFREPMTFFKNLSVSKSIVIVKFNFHIHYLLLHYK